MSIPRFTSETLPGLAVFAVHAAVVVLALACPCILIVDTVFSEGRFDAGAWVNVYGDLDRWASLSAASGRALAIAWIVNLPIGTAVGALLLRSDLFARRFGVAVLLAAATVPFYVSSSAWIALCGVEPLQKSPELLGVIHGVAMLPLTALIVGFTLRTVDSVLEKGALVDGATNIQAFTHVTLRLASSGIAASAVLVALWLVSDYSASDLLLVRTFAEEVYTQFQLNVRPREATLVALPLWVVFSVLSMLIVRSHIDREPSAAGGGQPHRFRVRRARWVLSALVAAICFATIALPTAFIYGQIGEQRTLAYYLKVFTPELTTSLWTSALAGATCGILGVGVAWFAVRSRLKLPIVAYVSLSLALPAPLFGMGLIRIFNRPGILGAIYDSPFMLPIGYICRFLPIAVILLVPWVRAVSIDNERAARVDGCGTFGVWRGIVFPQCAAGVLVSACAVMALSIGELPCSYLVQPPRLPVRRDDVLQQNPLRSRRRGSGALSARDGRARPAVARRRRRGRLVSANDHTIVEFAPDGPENLSRLRMPQDVRTLGQIVGEFRSSFECSGRIETRNPKSFALLRLVHLGWHGPCRVGSAAFVK